MRSPSVSVIVPVYNAGKYLDECIRSILDQSMEDFELLLVDDGSTDESGKICETFAGRDSRIRVIHKENGGVSSARNAGILQAKGERICFIDADDTVDRDYLRNLYHAADNEPDDLLVIGGLRKCWTQKGLHERVLVFGDALFAKDKTEFHDFFRWLCNHTCYSVAKLYNRNILKENKLLFDEDVSTGEDRIFVFKYLKYIKFVKCIRYADYNYLWRGDWSLSLGIRSPEQEYGSFREIAHLHAYFREEGMPVESFPQEIRRRIKRVFMALYFPNKRKISRERINMLSMIRRCLSETGMPTLASNIGIPEKYFLLRIKDVSWLLKYSLLYPIYISRIRSRMLLKIALCNMGVVFRSRGRGSLLQRA